MEITERTVQLDSRWFSPERNISRTKGLHLSHIIDYIEYLEGKQDSVHRGPLSDIGNAYASGGFQWERVLTNLIERNPTELWEWLYGRVLSEPDNPKVIRPGEQCMDGGKCPVCDGKGYVVARFGEMGDVCKVCEGTGRILIYLTPDGYHIDDVMLEEWKYTTKSSDNDIRGYKFRRWLSWQIPSYLKALGLNVCRLRVYFARGNYKSPVPVWREYILNYSGLEIDETWDSICINAAHMMQNTEISRV